MDHATIVAIPTAPLNFGSKLKLRSSPVSVRAETTSRGRLTLVDTVLNHTLGDIAFLTDAMVMG